MRRALIVVALVCGGGLAAASPAQDLDKARTSFRAKDCQSAMPLLAFVLNPVKLSQRDDIVEARSMLGACYFDTGDRNQARAEFEQVLQLQPDKSLGDLLYSAGAIRLFEDTKADLAARAERDKEAQKLADDREKIRKYKESLVVYEARSYGVNFVPFGAGQFQEKRNGRGIFFAASQGVTGGVSAGVFLYLSTKYGLIAKVPLAEGPIVRRLQQIEIATGVAAIGFYALGVVDALLHYSPRARVEGDDSLLPPDLLDPPKPTKKTSFRDRLRLGPMVTPGGVGLGIGWEN